jgi:glycosyltransferase involved in cell wall biosynthesis
VLSTSEQPIVEDPAVGSPAHGESSKPRAIWLFVAPWAQEDFRGVNQVITNLARSISDRGAFTPCVLVVNWESQRLTMVHGPSGVEARYRLRSPWDSINPVKNLIAFLRELPSMVKTVSSLVRSNNIAVVNPHYPTLGSLIFSILRAAKVVRFRFIVSVHGAEIRNAKKAAVFEKILWRVLLRSADAVVACSEQLASEVREAFPVVRARTISIHNGIDPQTFFAGRDPEYSLPVELRNRRYVLTVASFERKKGLDVLVRAMTELRDEFPDLHVAIVGNAGPERDPIRTLVEDLGLSQRVHLLVDLPHSRIAAFMERARVFVLPSRIEPFGLVLLEAGVCSVPVVATSVGGIPEIIEHEVSGLLVRPDDPPAVAVAIGRILSLPAEAERLAQALKERVTTRFSWARALDQYLSIAD